MFNSYVSKLSLQLIHTFLLVMNRNNNKNTELKLRPNLFWSNDRPSSDGIRKLSRAPHHQRLQPGAIFLHASSLNIFAGPQRVRSACSTPSPARRPPSARSSSQPTKANASRSPPPCANSASVSPPSLRYPPATLKSGLACYPSNSFTVSKLDRNARSKTLCTKSRSAYSPNSFPIKALTVANWGWLWIKESTR